MERKRATKDRAPVRMYVHSGRLYTGSDEWGRHVRYNYRHLVHKVLHRIRYEGLQVRMHHPVTFPTQGCVFCCSFSTLLMGQYRVNESCRTSFIDRAIYFGSVVLFNCTADVLLNSSVSAALH